MFINISIILLMFNLNDSSLWHLCFKYGSKTVNTFNVKRMEVDRPLIMSLVTEGSMYQNNCSFYICKSVARTPWNCIYLLFLLICNFEPYSLFQLLVNACSGQILHLCYLPNMHSAVPLSANKSFFSYAVLSTTISLKSEHNSVSQVL